MEILEEKYWNLFQADGKLFEELVKTLLELEYDGKTFHITSASHDGARDIEATFPLPGNFTADIWAECKYRSKRLPVHQVAMTLVMAYIERAQGIFFFSYSPVTKTFSSYLSRFRERSGIQIRVFDDCRLEELILKHKKKQAVRNFFPDFFREEIIKTERNIISDMLAVNCDVLQNGKKVSCKTRRTTLPYATLTDNITLWLTLKNQSATESCRIAVSLPDIGINPDFISLSSSPMDNELRKEMTLSPGEITNCYFEFRIRRFSGMLHLPKIRVDWDNHQKLLNPGCFLGKWLAEAPLIGAEFFSTLDAQRKEMQSQNISIMQIRGRSGIGKSRLLKEILLQASVEKKSVFLWDMDIQKGTHVALMRSLVSTLEGFPLLQTAKKGIFMVEGQMPPHRLFGAQLLYQKGMLSRSSSRELAEYLLELMREKAVWIAIDNVQNCDEKTLDMLDNLVDAIQMQTGDSGMVLAFNEDLLFQGQKRRSLRSVFPLCPPKSRSGTTRSLCMASGGRRRLNICVPALVAGSRGRNGGRKPRMNLKKHLKCSLTDGGASPFIFKISCCT